MPDDKRLLPILDQPLTRRSILQAAGLAALAIPAACLPPETGGARSTGGTSGGTSGGSTGGSSGGTSSGGADAGRGPACETNANTLVLTLADHPEIASPNGIGVYTDNRYSDPICQGNVFAVVNQGNGQFSAFSASCTHQCCEVSPAGNVLECPCHRSTYDLTGKVLTGPAYQNLPSIPVCFDGTGVYVQLA